MRTLAEGGPSGGEPRPSVFAIPKTSDPGHAEDNAAAAGIELTDEEIRRIGEAFPLGRRRKGVPTL